MRQPVTTTHTPELEWYGADPARKYGQTWAKDHYLRETDQERSAHIRVEISWRTIRLGITTFVVSTNQPDWFSADIFQWLMADNSAHLRGICGQSFPSWHLYATPRTDHPDYGTVLAGIATTDPDAAFIVPTLG